MFGSGPFHREGGDVAADERLEAGHVGFGRCLAATGTTLMDLHSIGPSGTARLLIEVGAIIRFPDRGHFASWNGPRTHRRVLRRPGSSPAP